MLNNLEHITISKINNSSDDLDYDFLRKEGIAYIESLSSNVWTDYNSHDPGITILELLCYAITDLSNRMELPMQDLLATENGIYEDQFHKASAILSINPVTPLDYRKLFIDIPGVRNAWLRKHEKTVFANCKDDLLSYRSFDDMEGYDHLKDRHKKEFALNGLYDILVDLERDANFDEIKPQIRQRYHANRNLCEDLVHISEVTEHKIKVCANIDLDPQCDEDQVKAEILFALQEYFSPAIRPYTLKELLDKGYTPDSIFNGPLLDNGFLDDDEVQRAALRTQIRQSDLINIIMDIEGVNFIREISIGPCNNEDPKQSDWLICVNPGEKPALCEQSSFSFTKGFIPLNINETRVKAHLDTFREAEQIDLELIAKASKELELPKGKFSDAGTTTTVMNDLPEVYGAGIYGSKSTSSKSDKAKAKQLKGYLLFFDQILANYFAHLNKIKDLYAINGEQSTTYFAQAIKDVKNFEELVNSYEGLSDEELTDLLYPDYEEINRVRRHEILDHLMARFAESFGNYAFLMKQIYGSFADEAVVSTKKSFIKGYAANSVERARSFDYFNKSKEELWDTTNISAFQKRIYSFLGITDINRRNLSEDYIEIYEEVDDDDIIEYRWRIKDGTKTILSSATKHYHSLEELYQELVQVKHYALNLDNYKFKKIKKSDTDAPDRWHFVLINPDVEDTKSEGYIIARRISTFQSKANAQKASKEVLNFIKSLTGNEGMYVIEHILLRPDVEEDFVELETFLPICTDDCERCEPLDPYSFRVSIVLPGWTERFSNMDFRKFMEDLLRKELPAHILAKICWIGYQKNYTDEDGNPPEENEMVVLEEAYKLWLESKTDKEQAQDETALKDLNAILSSLHTIYDQGKLHRCRSKEGEEAPDETSEEKKKKIILGRTHLGKL